MIAALAGTVEDVEATCETCGKTTDLDVKLCGQCAEDWNRPDGKATIDRRRKANDLPPLHSGRAGA